MPLLSKAIHAAVEMSSTTLVQIVVQAVAQMLGGQGNG